MAEIPARLVEVGAFFGDGYQPVLDFHGWRVAMLRRDDAVASDRFHRVERHRETNEVFILTAGRADLIVCDGDARPAAPVVFPMEPNVAYNIAQAVWHHVVMSPDAHIILVERSDTSVANTDYAELPPDQLAAITARFTVGRNA
jgi:ureidoglycolate hydrolase